MRHSLKVGLSFGLTSGVITTLGLVVGLYAGTHSRLAVLGGIITIAIADAFSDALGIHISEESEAIHSSTEIWEATLATFFFKFLVAMSFAAPLLLLPVQTAVTTCIVGGLMLLALLSWYVARSGKAVLEHLLIAATVILTSQLVGGWVAARFG